MNILIVEDEVNLADEVAKYLSDFKYKCHVVNLYNDALQSLNYEEFAITLIDLKLPDGHGIDLIHYIKKKKITSGIIVLSAIDELDMRIKALDAGADDFLTKPFHLSELNARVKSLIRRNFHKGDNVIDYNEIKVDTTKLQVSVLDQVINLTSKEYELLLYFISNAGKVITKEAIGYTVWNNHSDMDVSNEIIYTHVKNLRKKLVAAGSKDYIQSVYGVGYKFDK
ncbi:MAG: response regulator transcription factor [Bacteroidetes bacterium]|nr:response regulator transcription factor [Bacteroidota bacterium]